MRTSRLRWRRCILPNESFSLQLAPEVLRDRVAHVAQIAIHLSRADGAWNDRSHRTVAERELQGRRWQRVHHGARILPRSCARALAPVRSPARNCSRRSEPPGRRDAGVEHASDDDADAALAHLGHLEVERVLLHQGVAHG